MNTSTNANNKTLGSKGEDLAVDYLLKQGCKIIERNFTFSNKGEIDIIAEEEDGTIAFVEVKTRYSTEYGYPEDAITATKKKQIKKVAEFFVYSKNYQDRYFRFDVVAITIINKQEPEVLYLKDAFY